jgi:hypothetical protein
VENSSIRDAVVVPASVLIRMSDVLSGYERNDTLQLVTGHGGDGKLDAESRFR